MQALFALLSHGIDGNDVEAMKKVKEQIQDYLILKWKSLGRKPRHFFMQKSPKINNNSLQVYTYIV